VLTLPGILVGILLSPFQAPSFYSDILSVKVATLLSPGNPQSALPWAGSVIGAIMWGLIPFLVAFAYEKVRGRAGLGMGDVKMMAMVGAFLGWRLAFLTMFSGSLLGLFLGLYLIIFRKMNFQTKLAFGVFLGIGAALSLFFGFSSLEWYSNFYR
jgi:leader peptidase (prepilin peptidase)/N-methyltransferase